MAHNPREEALFSEALSQPPARRHAFLERACQGDRALIQRILSLLAAHEDPDTLESDAPEPHVPDRGAAE